MSWQTYRCAALALLLVLGTTTEAICQSPAGGRPAEAVLRAVIFGASGKVAIGGDIGYHALCSVGARCDPDPSRNELQDAFGWSLGARLEYGRAVTASVGVELNQTTHDAGYGGAGDGLKLRLIVVEPRITFGRALLPTRPRLFVGGRAGWLWEQLTGPQPSGPESDYTDTGSLYGVSFGAAWRLSRLLELEAGVTFNRTRTELYTEQRGSLRKIYASLGVVALRL